MNKVVIGTLGALAIILGLGVYNAKADQVEPAFKTQVIETVVQLERNCSGVVLDTSGTNTYVVTANHCVDGEQSGFVTIDTKDKQKIIETEQLVFDVIRRSVSNDLAVLKLRKEGLQLNGATLAQEDPSEGEQVWTVGYPLGLTRTVTEGFFGGFQNLKPDMSFDQFGNGRPVYRATPPIYGGNSGGGMFVKAGDHYNLVGITDAGVTSFFVAGFYNPQTEINEIVKGALDSEATTDKPTIEQRKKSD